ENLIAEMNERGNRQGGYVYVDENGRGLTTDSKPLDQNPTMAIQLLGGAFRIANSKLRNGEFEWRTYGDGNGCVADMIVAGIIKGVKVEFNLTNGSLFIGDNLDDYVLFFDGQDLHLSGDFTTYNQGNKAIHMTNNAIRFHNWLAAGENN